MIKYDELMGKPFLLGTNDCFRIVIDFYSQNYGIKIRNYARPSDWDADKLDLIGTAFEAEGFHPVYDWTLKNLHVGDVLCMAIGSNKANHFAIYVGGNKIIHHKVASLSTEETLRDFWKNSIIYVLRHPDTPHEDVEKPDINIQDILNERNHLQA